MIDTFRGALSDFSRIVVADDDDLFGRTQSFGQIVRQVGPIGGAGADCRPGGGEE